MRKVAAQPVRRRHESGKTGVDSSIRRVFRRVYVCQVWKVCVVCVHGVRFGWQILHSRGRGGVTTVGVETENRVHGDGEASLRRRMARLRERGIERRERRRQGERHGQGEEERERYHMVNNVFDVAALDVADKGIIVWCIALLM